MNCLSKRFKITPRICCSIVSLHRATLSDVQRHSATNDQFYDRPTIYRFTNGAFFGIYISTTYTLFVFVLFFKFCISLYLLLYKVVPLRLTYGKTIIPFCWTVCLILYSFPLVTVTLYLLYPLYLLYMFYLLHLLLASMIQRGLVDWWQGKGQ